MNWNYNYNFIESINQQGYARNGLVVKLDYWSYPGSGSTWFDDSGNGNNGTITGALVNSGSLGWAFTSGSQIQLSSGIIPGPSGNYDNFTLQAFFTITSGSNGNQMLFNKRGTTTTPRQGFFTSYLYSGSAITGGGPILSASANSLAYTSQYGGNSVGANQTTSPIQPNPTTTNLLLHTLAVSNASDNTFNTLVNYTDEYPILRLTNTAVISPFNSTNNTQNLSFGGSVGSLEGYNNFGGTLKYLWVYNRTLTPNEIANNLAYFRNYIYG